MSVPKPNRSDCPPTFTPSPEWLLAVIETVGTTALGVAGVNAGRVVTVNAIAANLAGLPAMSIPVAPVDGKPVGLQIVGDYFNEARLLNVAHRLQQVTDWHLAIPEGFA